MYFRYYGLAKRRLDSVSKKCRFTVPFDNQHGTRPQAHFKSSPPHLSPTFWTLGMIFTLENSLLVICKKLFLFVNTFITNDKYSPLSRGNLTQPTQKQFSQKRKTFSQFLSLFSKSRLNFEHFQEKVDPRSSCISQTTNSQRGG